MALIFSQLTSMYSCRCCKCKPANIGQFLTNPEGCVSLSAYFGHPVVKPSEYIVRRWRIITDGCGYDLTYYIGTFLPDGSMDPGHNTLEAGQAGWKSATKEFCSTYPYLEGMLIQVGCPSTGYGGMLWPDRPCLAGASGSPGFDLEGMSIG